MLALIRTRLSPSGNAPMAARISPRSRPPWATVVDRPAASATWSTKSSVRSSSLIWLLVSVAALSNENPWLLFAAVMSLSSDSFVARSVPIERNCGFMLATVAAPRASIRMSGSRCSQGRRKNASRTFSITRLVMPSGSVLVSVFNRARVGFRGPAVSRARLAATARECSPARSDLVRD